MIICDHLLLIYIYLTMAVIRKKLLTVCVFLNFLSYTINELNQIGKASYSSYSMTKTETIALSKDVVVL